MHTQPICKINTSEILISWKILWCAINATIANSRLSNYQIAVKMLEKRPHIIKFVSNFQNFKVYTMGKYTISFGSRGWGCILAIIF